MSSNHTQVFATASLPTGGGNIMSPMTGSSYGPNNGVHILGASQGTTFHQPMSLCSVSGSGVPASAATYQMIASGHHREGHNLIHHH